MHDSLDSPANTGAERCDPTIRNCTARSVLAPDPAPAATGGGARCADDEVGVAVPDRVQALALDILHRLRPVCAHMPDEELLTLATRMAAIELKHFESAFLPRAPRRYVGRR